MEGKIGSARRQEGEGKKKCMRDTGSRGGRQKSIREGVCRKAGSVQGRQKVHETERKYREETGSGGGKTGTGLGKTGSA